jgi:hypothetical protein
VIFPEATVARPRSFPYAALARVVDHCGEGGTPGRSVPLIKRKSGHEQCVLRLGDPRRYLCKVRFSLSKERLKMVS